MVSSDSKKAINNVDAATARKILNPVAYEKGFHFFCTDGHYTGETAISLESLSKDLERVDIQSIRYHFNRGDFQKWIRTTLCDGELANRIDRLDKNCQDDKMHNQLTETVQKRLSELQSIAEQRRRSSDWR